ncbi:hypothetical protein BCR34DRAFT_597769 [Clohesyomyces aquaticus]|uniref:Uncharacterized protein n=1 Tax=Clohesyomyces aquaticus TaxID=1231657 RepID=A0A1Y2A176_9PLEO|nr:hypothetical protein BCR34DRAFT_597769 [Clohesyomyces aquaticus]
MWAKCEADIESTYRIISGASNGTCYTFDGGMPATNCAEYTKGGAEGPTGCTGSSLLPKSVHQKNGNLPCTFYTDESRKGDLVHGSDWCVDAVSLGYDNFKSFSCDWDQKVDVLANVACFNGMSTNVGVNDCNCRCHGIVLICPPESLTCTPTVYALCEENCNWESP